MIGDRGGKGVRIGLLRLGIDSVSLRQQMVNNPQLMRRNLCCCNKSLDGHPQPPDIDEGAGKT